jgi:hypothetical protein
MAKARPDPVALAEQVFGAVTLNGYGGFDRLIPAVFPALGKPGVAALKARLVAAMPKRPSTESFDSQSFNLR